MKRYIQVVSIFLVLISSLGVCQEGPKRATDLFPKNFVKQKNIEVVEGVGGEEQSPTLGTPKPKVEDLNSLKTKLDKLNPKVKTGELGDLTGDDSNIVKAISVGALISVADKKHAKDHIHELNEFNLQKKIPISKISLIGPPEESINAYQRLFKLGFSLDKNDQHESALILSNQQFLPNVPDIYSGVEYSPTWIIDTEFGLILVEGEQRPLQSYFDDKGNFKLGKIKLSRE